MRHLLRLLALATLILSVEACFSRRVTGESGIRTWLSVQNDNYLDHNIYLIEGTHRVRLGTARGLTTSRFVIPSRYVFGIASLQFLADPIGARITPISERLNVTPGDEVVLVIRAR